MQHWILALSNPKPKPSSNSAPSLKGRGKPNPYNHPLCPSRLLMFGSRNVWQTLFHAAAPGQRSFEFGMAGEGHLGFILFLPSSEQQ